MTATSTGPTLGPTTPYYGGHQVPNPANVIYVTGTPSTAAVHNSLGTIAVENSASTAWMLTSLSGGTATWTLLGTGSGAIETILGTAAQITASTTGTTTTLSLPTLITAPGSLATTTTLASGTTITATLGNITATNGNVVLGTAGNKLLSTSVASTTTAGANSFGSVALASGTATVATSAVTAASLIFLSRGPLNGATAVGELEVASISANTNFVINSCTLAAPGTPVAADSSIVYWMIVN